VVLVLVLVMVYVIGLPGGERARARSKSKKMGAGFFEYGGGGFPRFPEHASRLSRAKKHGISPDFDPALMSFHDEDTKSK
jgi:hypothetical protein